MVRALALGLIFYFGIILLGDFVTVVPDGTLRIDLAHSLVTEGSLVPHKGPIKYAPLQSLLMAPIYALGYYSGVLFGVPPENLSYVGEVFLFYLFLPVIISAICVFYFKILNEMGVDENTNIISTFLLFCGTLLLFYVRWMFSEPLNALLILISFYYFYISNTTNYIASNRKSFLCLGLLILNNFVFVLYAGLMIAYVFWGSWVNRKNKSEAWQLAFEGSLVLGLSGFLFLCYNYYRYDEFFNFGYTGERFGANLFVGIYGMLFSVGRGLIVYSPLTVFCAIFYFFQNPKLDLWRRYVLSTSLVSFLCFILVYSKWGSWHGGLGWGPRFLVPFVPLVHLIFPLVWKSLSPANNPLRIVVFLMIFLAIGMNLLGYLNPFVVYSFSDLGDDNKLIYNGIFNPEYSVLSVIWQSEFSMTRFYKFLMMLFLCASSLWLWKKRFGDKVFAPKLSISEAS